MKTSFGRIHRNEKETSFHRFRNYMVKLLGPEAVLFQSAACHRRLRRVLEPGFSPMAIRGYLELIIDETTKIELEKWCAKGDFCSSKEWSLLAMRLFFVCAFGPVEEELLQRLSRLFTTWFNGVMAILPFAIIPGAALCKAHAAGKELGEILQDMIDEFKSNNPPESDGAKNSMMGRLCYGVDDDGNTLTDSQLTRNIQFILFAGHDTTKGSFGSLSAHHQLTDRAKLNRVVINQSRLV